MTPPRRRPRRVTDVFWGPDTFHFLGWKTRNRFSKWRDGKMAKTAIEKSHWNEQKMKERGEGIVGESDINFVCDRFGKWKNYSLPNSFLGGRPIFDPVWRSFSRFPGQIFLLTCLCRQHYSTLELSSHIFDGRYRDINLRSFLWLPSFPSSFDLHT